MAFRKNTMGEKKIIKGPIEGKKSINRDFLRKYNA
jgi:hypothetical protein